MSDCCRTRIVWVSGRERTFQAVTEQINCVCLEQLGPIKSLLAMRFLTSQSFVAAYASGYAQRCMH